MVCHSRSSDSAEAVSGRLEGAWHRRRMPVATSRGSRSAGGLAAQREGDALPGGLAYGCRNHVKQRGERDVGAKKGVEADVGKVAKREHLGQQQKGLPGLQHGPKAGRQPAAQQGAKLLAQRAHLLRPGDAGQQDAQRLRGQGGKLRQLGGAQPCLVSVQQVGLVGVEVIQADDGVGRLHGQRVGRATAAGRQRLGAQQPDGEVGQNGLTEPV